jgi:mono/diheme cytochrome c family protein
MQHQATGAGIRLGTAAFFMAAGVWPVAAQDALNGRALAEENCAMCHAVTKDGSSPNPAAPPLRSIGQRLSLDDLQDMLERGTLFASHPQMPNFRMTRGAARAITIYLRSIQD